MKRTWKNFSKYRYLLIELVRKNIRLKYRNSWLGIFWTILQPLLNMMVLTMVFSGLFGRENSASVICYPVYLLSGRLIFEFFTQSTKRALRSFRENAAIVKKVYVPKYMYPLSGVLSNYVTFGISLVVLFVVTIFFKLTGFSNGGAIQLTYRVLFIVVPLLILLLLSIGVGLILSTLAVYFRDIEYIYDVLSTLLFYLCPIIYPASMLESQPLVYNIIKFNPLYSIIEMLRQCMLYGRDLSWEFILYPSVAAILALVLGIYLFKKKSDDFILHI
ncbi:MAG: ABC transporter permease [Clostridiales bacterium]|nr:ABC transporter permease [Clostridiales bacterium]